MGQIVWFSCHVLWPNGKCRRGSSVLGNVLGCSLTPAGRLNDSWKYQAHAPVGLNMPQKWSLTWARVRPNRKQFPISRQWTTLILNWNSFSWMLRDSKTCVDFSCYCGQRSLIDQQQWSKECLWHCVPLMVAFYQHNISNSLSEIIGREALVMFWWCDKLVGKFKVAGVSNVGLPSLSLTGKSLLHYFNSGHFGHNSNTLALLDFPAKVDKYVST